MYMLNAFTHFLSKYTNKQKDTVIYKTTDKYRYKATHKYTNIQIYKGSGLLTLRHAEDRWPGERCL